MIFPIADDNTDRTTTPIVNYILIAVNILVFVFLQQIGSNDRFTYAFSTVPQEIVSGEDIRTSDRVLEHPVTGQQLLGPGSAADSSQRLPDLNHVDVYAWWHCAPFRKHALSVDFRR